jgi:hypothetical protein
MGFIVFGTKRDEVTGEWRKLHHRNDLYCPTNIVRVIKLRRMRSEEHVSSVGERIFIYRDLVGNLGIESTSKTQYNIKMDLQEVGCSGMDWTEMARDRDR